MNILHLSAQELVRGCYVHNHVSHCSFARGIQYSAPVACERGHPVPVVVDHRGATDNGGDACGDLVDQDRCDGSEDDGDFSASSMCCTCGGGSPEGATQRSIKGQQHN